MMTWWNEEKRRKLAGYNWHKQDKDNISSLRGKSSTLPKLKILCLFLFVFFVFSGRFFFVTRRYSDREGGVSWIFWGIFPRRESPNKKKEKKTQKELQTFSLSSLSFDHIPSLHLDSLALFRRGRLSQVFPSSLPDLLRKKRKKK